MRSSADRFSASLAGHATGAGMSGEPVERGRLIAAGVADDGGDAAERGDVAVDRAADRAAGGLVRCGARDVAAAGGASRVATCSTATGENGTAVAPSRRSVSRSCRAMRWRRAWSITQQDTTTRLAWGRWGRVRELHEMGGFSVRDEQLHVFGGLIRCKGCTTGWLGRA